VSQPQYNAKPTANQLQKVKRQDLGQQEEFSHIEPWASLQDGA